jgi:hypothetical protein
MPSSELLHRVALVRTSVLEKRIDSNIRVTRIGNLGTALAVHRVLRLLVTANVPNSPILATLMMEAIRSSEMSVLTRATWSSIPEYGMLHSHCRENPKSYTVLPSVFLLLCNCCHGKAFTEMLPSNIDVQTQTGGKQSVKSAIQMGSGVMMYIPSFMKLVRGYRHTDMMIS